MLFGRKLVPAEAEPHPQAVAAQKIEESTTEMVIAGTIRGRRKASAKNQQAFEIAEEKGLLKEVDIEKAQITGMQGGFGILNKRVSPSEIDFVE